MKKGASDTALLRVRWISLAYLGLGVACALLAANSLGQEAGAPAGGPINEFEINPAVRFLGGLHPFSTHFPIALVVAAFLFETTGLTTGNKGWATTAFHCLTLGSSVSLLTVILGLMASELGPFIGEDAETLWAHRLFGLISCGLLLLTTFVAARSRRGELQGNATLIWGYRALLLLTLLFVLSAALFGSRLTGLAPF
ncbi:MAG: DUF2231 domain-containing protein [Candidatus Zixiibacteriota bacterium]